MSSSTFPFFAPDLKKTSTYADNSTPIGNDDEQKLDGSSLFSAIATVGLNQNQEAITRRLTEVYKTLSNTGKVDFAQKNALGETPLIAATKRDVKVVKALMSTVKKEKKVEHQECMQILGDTIQFQGKTAMQHAIAFGSLELVWAIKSEDYVVEQRDFSMLNECKDIDKAGSMLEWLWRRSLDPVTKAKESYQEAAKTYPALALKYLDHGRTQIPYSTGPFFHFHRSLLVAATSVAEPDYSLISALCEFCEPSELSENKWEDPSFIVKEAFQRRDTQLLYKMQHIKKDIFSCLSTDLPTINVFLAKFEYQGNLETDVTLMRMIPFAAALRHAVMTDPLKAADQILKLIKNFPKGPRGVIEHVRAHVLYAVDVITGEKTRVTDLDPEKLSERLGGAYKSKTKSETEIKSEDKPKAARQKLDLETAVAQDDFAAVEAMDSRFGKGKALLQALKNNQPYAYLIAEALLAKKDINLDFTDDDNKTALFYAARAGFLCITRTILAIKGDKKEIKEEEIKAALYEAIKNNRVFVVQELLPHCSLQTLQVYVADPMTVLGPGPKPDREKRLQMLGAIVQKCTDECPDHLRSGMLEIIISVCKAGERDIAVCYLQNVMVNKYIIKGLHPFTTPSAYEIGKIILEYRQGKTKLDVDVKPLIEEAKKRKDFEMLCFIFLGAYTNLRLSDYPGILIEFLSDQKNAEKNRELFKKIQPLIDFWDLMKTAEKVSPDFLLAVGETIHPLLADEKRNQVRERIEAYLQKNPAMRTHLAIEKLRPLFGVSPDVEFVLDATRGSIAAAKTSQSYVDAQKKGLSREIKAGLEQCIKGLTSLQQAVELKADPNELEKAYQGLKKSKEGIEGPIEQAVIRIDPEMQTQFGQMVELFSKVDLAMGKAPAESKAEIAAPRGMLSSQSVFTPAAESTPALDRNDPTIPDEVWVKHFL